MSEKNSLARKAYWESQSPEKRSLRASNIAKKKQSLLTFKQKRDHALKMVEGRKRRARERVEALRNSPYQNSVV